MNQRSNLEVVASEHKQVSQKKKKKFKYEVIETNDGIIVKEIPRFKTTTEQEKARRKCFTFLNIDKKQKEAEKQAIKRIEEAKKVTPIKSVAEFEDMSLNKIYTTVLKLPFISIFSNEVNEGVKVRNSEPEIKDPKIEINPLSM